MTKTQKVYRELRRYVSKDDARYTVVRFVELGVI